MMACRTVQDRAAPYLEGLLSRQELVEIQDHLSTCDSCREVYEQARSVTFPGAQRKPTPPIDLSAELNAILTAEPKVKRGALSRVHGWLAQETSFSRASAAFYLALLTSSICWATVEHCSRVEFQRPAISSQDPAPQKRHVNESLVPVGYRQTY